LLIINAAFGIRALIVDALPARASSALQEQTRAVTIAEYTLLNQPGLLWLAGIDLSEAKKLKCTVNPSKVSPGDIVAVAASFPHPNTAVYLYFDGDLTRRGNGVTDNQGKAVVAVRIPDNMTVGKHLISLYFDGGSPSSVDAANCYVKVVTL
jgi:hypothetical protein